MKTFNMTVKAAAVLAVAAAASMASAQTTLTISSWLPPTHPVPTVLTTWAKNLEVASNGRIKTQILAKPVSSPPGTYNAVRDGLADISFAVQGYTPGRFKLSEFAELPLTSESSEKGSVLFHRISHQHKAIMNEYKDVKVLALFTHGPGVIMSSSKEVASLEDMKRLKYRVGGGIVNDVAKVLDVNSTLKPAGETYELLSTGVMDGTWLPYEGMVTFKLDKVVRHITTFPGGLYNSVFMAIMNRKAYDALSKEDRAVIDQSSGEALARMMGRGFDERDNDGKAMAKAANIKTIQAPPAMVKDVAASIRVLESKWIEDAKAKGLADPAAVLTQFREEAKK